VYPTLILYLVGMLTCLITMHTVSDYFVLMQCFFVVVLVLIFHIEGVGLMI
jgi:hypothetical protein